MSVKKTLQMILEQNHQMDTSKLLTNILCEQIFNQKYLQAVAESQLYIMQQLEPKSNFNIEKELEKLNDRIVEAADEEIIEVLQNIISKD